MDPAGICRERLLDEKWLLAPSLRVGQQWLDRVAREGCPVVNVRLLTPRTLALYLAEPELARRGSTFLGGRGAAVVMHRVWSRVREEGAGYLSSLPAGESLSLSLLGTVQDLRLAGLSNDDLPSRAFEHPDKGRELRLLLWAWERELKRLDLLDYPALLSLATAMVEKGSANVAASFLPDDSLMRHPAERRLMDAVARRATVTALPGRPAGDVETAFFRAWGEVNEVRHVLRTCLAEGTPLDTVELLHTEGATYVPLVYETMLSSLPSLEEGFEPPVTFAEGLPARLTRPGRALLGWLEWSAKGRPASILDTMLREGLLEAPGNPARRLRSLTPKEGLGPGAWLSAAGEFLADLCRVSGRLDAYARDALLDEIRDLSRWLGGDPAHDPRPWLARLPGEVPVGGSGPRPGCLHVAHLLAGGHSGRERTFVVGLDEGRFPGAGRQDPVLLDSERKRLSPELPLSPAERKERARGLAELRRRVRGRLVLGYPCRSLKDDRELFPSSGFQDVFREVNGTPGAGPDDIKEALPPPASYAPGTPAGTLDEADWWLWRLSGDDAVENAPQVLAHHYPHLGRGLAAAEARREPRFTPFDGLVPEAGVSPAPSPPDGKALSPSRLQELAECPRRYFFRYVLGVEPLEEPPVPGLWLDPAAFGSLVHDILHRFMKRLLDAGLLPSAERDGALMDRVAEELVEEQKKAVPVVSEAGLHRRVTELKAVTRAFLVEEERFCRSHRPVLLEERVAAQPVGVPGIGEIAFTGRLDRLDRDETAGGFVITDYKTGGSRNYGSDDFYRSGRILQPVIYPELARALPALEGSPALPGFRFLFVGTQERGESISPTAEQHGLARRALALVLGLMKSGLFPPTDEKNDCAWCDFRPACGPVPFERGKELLGCAAGRLEAFAELRGKGAADD